MSKIKFVLLWLLIPFCFLEIVFLIVTYFVNGYLLQRQAERIFLLTDSWFLVVLAISIPSSMTLFLSLRKLRRESEHLWKSILFSMFSWFVLLHAVFLIFQLSRPGDVTRTRNSARSLALLNEEIRTHYGRTQNLPRSLDEISMSKEGPLYSRYDLFGYRLVYAVDSDQKGYKVVSIGALRAKVPKDYIEHWPDEFVAAVHQRIDESGKLSVSERTLCKSDP